MSRSGKITRNPDNNLVQNIVMKFLMLCAIPITALYLVLPYVIVALQTLFFGHIIDASIQ